jgi:hypothetical protein
MPGSFQGACFLIRIDSAYQIRAEPDLFHMEIVIQSVQLLSQRSLIFITLAQREAEIICQ